MLKNIKGFICDLKKKGLPQKPEYKPPTDIKFKNVFRGGGLYSCFFIVPKISQKCVFFMKNVEKFQKKSDEHFGKHLKKYL